jgi:hypothetical protein
MSAGAARCCVTTPPFAVRLCEPKHEHKHEHEHAHAHAMERGLTCMTRRARGLGRMWICWIMRAEKE